MNNVGIYSKSQYQKILQLMMVIRSVMKITCVCVCVCVANCVCALSR